MGPRYGSIPFGVWFIRLFDQVDVRDLARAVEGRAVFELHRLGRSAPASSL